MQDILPSKIKFRFFDKYFLSSLLIHLRCKGFFFLFDFIFINLQKFLYSREIFNIDLLWNKEYIQIIKSSKTNAFIEIFEEESLIKAKEVQSKIINKNSITDIKMKKLKLFWKVIKKFAKHKIM